MNSTTEPANPQKTTIVFDNRRMPLVTTAEVQSVWLGYVYLNFGGDLFKYVPSKTKPGVYFGWRRITSPYSDGIDSTHWVGEFKDAATLDAALKRADIDPPMCGTIIESVAGTLGWDLPEE